RLAGLVWSGIYAADGAALCDRGSRLFGIRFLSRHNYIVHENLFLLLSAFSRLEYSKAHDCFDVMGLRQHIECRDVFDAVASIDQRSQIACENARVARDV